MVTLNHAVAPRTRAVVLGVSVLLSACAGAPEDQEAVAARPAWELRFGGVGFQAPTAMAHLGSSTVVGGVYQDEMSIGDVHLDAGGDVDGFLTALGENGEVLWAQAVVGSGPDAVIALTGDGVGGLFLGGQAADGSTLADQTLETSASAGALFARFAAGGELLWARLAQGSAFQAATAVAVAPNGGVYFGGDFTGDFELEGELIASSDAFGDAFVARFDADGALGWVAVLRGVGVQHVAHLSADADGSVIVAGVFDEHLVLPGVQAVANSMTNGTPFVAKLSDAGSGVWMTTALLPPELDERSHGHGHDHASGATALGEFSLDVAPNGEVVTAVSFGDMFALHPQDFEAPNFSNVATTRLAADGRVLWQRTLAGNSTVSLAGARAMPQRTSIVTSWAGTLDVGELVLQSAGELSVLLVDSDEQGELIRARQFGVDGASVSSDVAIAADDATMVAARLTEPGLPSSDVFVARIDD